MRLALILLLGVAAARAEAPLRILFLGNSYTYFNHLAGLVEGMARAAGGRPVEARSVTLGGATLERLYMETEALAVLREGKWDLVVLQEQSTLGLNQFNGDMVVNRPESFFAWARIWDGEIRRAGARTVFLNTWARKGRGELQPHVDWAYAAIARELGAGLIPAGTAFQNVTGVELFQPDGSHPSEAGSFLAACTAVEILFADGCAGAPAMIEGIPMDNRNGRLQRERGTIVRLSEETAAVLRRAALAAVDRLRGEGGYWRMARPVYAGEAEGGVGQGEWRGRWEGAMWLYGKRANVTLQVGGEEGKCTGTWRITAAEPLTDTTLPLENCSLAGGRLLFTVTPLFMNSESHVAWVENGNMQGQARLSSPSGYHRQTGTWTLQRVTP